MANPNKTVQAFRRRKLVLVDEKIFQERLNAEWMAAELRKCNPHSIVRLTRFRIGPRSWRQRVYNYAVRTYQRGAR